jgi:putative nucleotidyltransferase with HDIG domain
MIEKVSLLERVEATHDLLTIPDTLAEVLDAVSQDECAPDQLAAIIRKDPSLTAKVLRMANSSFYMRGTRIRTVQHGIRVLGANAIKCIALSVSIFQPPNKDSNLDPEVIRSFFFHCVGVGLLAKKIAQHTKLAIAEEAFVAGLLHDLGELLILNACPDIYQQIRKESDLGEDIVEVERRYFDVDHAELGSVMANRWRLPEELQAVIRSHHHMEVGPNTDRMLAIVRLSDIMARNIQAPNLRVMERNRGLVGELRDLLGLDQQFMDSLAFLMLDETITIAGSFGMDVGDPTELLNRANRELCKSYLMIENLFRERSELSGKLLEEERMAGMIRSKNIAIATLSHYLNNVATAISGRVQLMQMSLASGELIDNSGKIPNSLLVIERSITKVLAVLAELKSLSRFDTEDFYNDSDAINIDERIKERMEAIERSSVLQQV